MNRDQWHLFSHRCGGWQGVRLLADFDSARSQIVSGSGGGTYHFPDGTGGWYDTDTKGLHARHGVRTDDLVTVTWPEIRAWVADQPTSVVAAAKAMRKEWGEICHERFRDRHPGNLGPSYMDKYATCGPLTEEAARHVHCDHLERILRAAERDLMASLAPSDEPTDLLELLAAM